MLGDDEGGDPSECEEPLHSQDILSYEDKYMSNSKSGASKGMASVSRKIPAESSEEMRDRVRSIAVKAFHCLGCNGVARMDFMIDGDNGGSCISTRSIRFPVPWRVLSVGAGGNFLSELLDKMIALALKRQREEKALTFSSFDTNILDQQSLSGLKGARENSEKA